jgi:peptide/nickel transport system substrate-binding protein
LERNVHWSGPAPAFDRIVVRTIENTAALEANLRSGSIDYIAGELGLTIDQAIALERRTRGRYRFQYRAGLIYEHMDADLSHPILKDVRVRQALLLAANREGLSAALFGGRQPVADGPVAPADPASTKDLVRYPYAPERAAALLDDAGWNLDASGIRRNATGDPLTFDFMTTAGNRLRELAQQSLQSDWAKLGIRANIKNQPARVFFGETVTKRKFNGLAMYAWLSAPENPPRTTLHSDMKPTAENGWSGQNYPGYANPRVDALLDSIETELDQEKRRVLWTELQQIYATDLPALPLYFRAQPFVLPPWLTGIEPTGHQFSTTLWVENWRDGR